MQTVSIRWKLINLASWEHNRESPLNKNKSEKSKVIPLHKQIIVTPDIAPNTIPHHYS